MWLAGRAWLVLVVKGMVVLAGGRVMGMRARRAVGCDLPRRCMRMRTAG